MRTYRTAGAVFAILCWLAVSDAEAQSGRERTERIRFDAGDIAASVSGRIREGRPGVRYQVHAFAGQYLNVLLSSDSSASRFEVIEPGDDSAVVFASAGGQNEFEGVAAHSGDYTVRVFLDPSAATAEYDLEVFVMDIGDTPHVENIDGLVPGTEFHAVGDLPCAMGPGQPTARCPFGVRRHVDDATLVTVTKPDGRTRVIFFHDGEAVGFDYSEAHPGEFSATRRADLNVVTIDAERYEIPDVVVLGD